MSWLRLLVTALAIARATRLITTDTLTDSFRQHLAATETALVVRLGPNKTARLVLADFFSCPWCISVWLAALAGVELEIHFAWWFFWPLLLVLAFSFVAGWLASLSS